MKKIISAFTLILCLMACDIDKDDSLPYGPEVTINDIEVSARSLYSYEEKNDTVENDLLIIELKLTSNNIYALEYGINPQQKNKITNIKITSLENTSTLIQTNDDITSYFLFDNLEGNNLYQTIESFEKTGILSTLKGNLVFTNRAALHPMSDTLVSDTANLKIQVEVMFDGIKTYTDQTSVVLIPARSYSYNDNLYIE